MNDRISCLQRVLRLEVKLALTRIKCKQGKMHAKREVSLKRVGLIQKIPASLPACFMAGFRQPGFCCGARFSPLSVQNEAL